MSEETGRSEQVRRIRRLLRATARMAHDATLTGGFEKGARSAAQQYNQSLQFLENSGEVPPGFFRRLADEASFDEVGVAAAQLAAYITEDEEGDPGGGRKGRGLGDHNSITITGFGGLKELQELRDLGQVIREHLPDWMRHRTTEEREERRTEEEPNARSLTEVESRLAEVGARLQTVAEQLRRGDLDDERRAELAEQLSRLGQEQARLARQHAMLRERPGPHPPSPPPPPGM